MAAQQIAQGLAGLGRYGDSTLVHMQPEEVVGLQALAKSQGTSLTINPETGLPEAFNLGGFFKSLAPTLAGAFVSMIPGMQPFGLSAMQAGILAGASTGALLNRKDPLMGAAMGGLGGYGGANLATAAGSFGKQAAAAGVDPSIAAIQTPGALPSAATVAQNPIGFQNAANLNAGLPLSNATNTFETAMGLPISPANTGAQAGFATKAADPTFGSNLSQAASNVAQDPLGFIGQNKMAVGMPLAGAVLGGLEPSDLGYGTMQPGQNPNEKYDPYKSLSLDTDTGLRLYAQGGPVSFADGGEALRGGGSDALRGGDSDALEGSGLVPLDVSDITARYGYNPSAQSNMNMGIMGMTGRSTPSVDVPRLGLFASNDQIEAARTAYEAQLKAAMSGRGGMGSPYGFGGMNRMMGGMGANQGMVRGMGGMQNPNGGMNSMAEGMKIASRGTGSTAPTAPTAETALTRLNLNKTYANGGTIQGGGLQDLYGSRDDSMTGPALSRDGYGLGRLNAMAEGGVAGYAKGGYLDGPGDGMSDSIPATIEGRQPARLADGEFVIPADVVSHLGNGSTKAGSQRLYGMLDKVRKARTGTKKQGKQINPAKYMPA